MSKTENDYIEFYNENVSNYDLLVEKEDYQGNILTAINEILPIDTLDLVDIGAGSGRLAFLTAPKANSVKAYDMSEQMVELIKSKARDNNIDNITAEVADNCKLPVDDNSGDLLLAGWSLCHLVKWNWDNWNRELETALNEINRVLKPGGTIIIFETMGTGNSEPKAPDEKLTSYYSHLENSCGFNNKNIRTDYKFNSVEECEQIIGAFFGAELTKKIMKEDLITDGDNIIVPECTGVWWKTV